MTNNKAEVSVQELKELRSEARVYGNYVWIIGLILPVLLSIGEIFSPNYIVKLFFWAVGGGAYCWFLIFPYGKLLRRIGRISQEAK